MAETPQEYRQRLLGYVEGQDALKVQAATAAKIGRLMRGASPAKLRKKPAPGKWSAGEIVAHLADCEIVVSWRIRHVLGAPGTPIQAFDQDAWAAAGRYEKRDPRKSLDQFRAARDANLALFKTLTPEQWKLAGVHAERGEMSVELLAREVAGHDVNHLQQIERILARIPESKSGKRK